VWLRGRRSAAAIFFIFFLRADGSSSSRGLGPKPSKKFLDLVTVLYLVVSTILSLKSAIFRIILS